MGMVMLQILGLVLSVCAFACSMFIHGSAVSLASEETIGLVVNANVFISVAPTPFSQPNSTVLQPPLVMPPLMSALVPQTQSPIPSLNRPSPPPPDLPHPPPVPAMPPISPSGKPHQSGIPPPLMPQAPASVTSPPNNLPSKEQTAHPPVPPPNSHQAQAPVNSSPPPPPIAPVSVSPAPRTIIPTSPPLSPPVFPVEPPSLPPDISTPPAISRVLPPVKSILPNQSPSSPPDVSAPPASSRNLPPVKSVSPEVPPSDPPEQNVSPSVTPPPSISRQAAPMPIQAPANTPAHHFPPVTRFPAEAPASKPSRKSNDAPAPPPFPESTPESQPSGRHHHGRRDRIAPAPESHVIAPASGPHHAKPNPSSNHKAPSPNAGSSDSPISSPFPSSENNYSPSPTPSPSQTKIPFVGPRLSPPALPPRGHKKPLAPPFQAFPPPPPHSDCAPLTCADPLTYGPTEFPCVCVLPIQVGLRLTVAVYTFFPLVSELAIEIAAGVFMKPSQVRIMGANEAGDDSEKTIVLIDLVPLGERFDDTTALLTFQRFWHKQVVINSSFFGDYEVLYVRYPGLPPSPPSPSTIGVIGSKPYPGHGNNGETVQPLGVDVRKKQHKDGHKGSIIAAIVVSTFVAVSLLCAIVWVFLFKRRDHIHQLDPTTPPTTVRSLAKSSGRAGSTVGSGLGSPSFSLSSSIAAYTGSAKTFSVDDIERATDNFNETRILGEGGFGRVYSGTLDDGTKVAMKVLKRCDQQGAREFLAEVEMLSRLHHRNLVKLIGICIEDRTRCLVYELIPNGSVESHLHGIDKETTPLDWSSRLKIALGAARALAYLHEDSSPRVIHRDFKASNILLEDDFTPKVSDFGLARTALDEDNRHISTRVMGTFGYVAPEYAMTGHLLVKSDVYSYGVVLLELLTGKKPVDMSQPPGQENLVSWARPLLTSREGLEFLVDPTLGPNFPFDSIAKVAAIASMCVQPEVSHRPYMGEVVQALKLICNECDATKETHSRSSSQEQLSIDMEARNSPTSDIIPDPLLPQSPVSDYDYRLDVERDLSMSELLRSSAKFERDDSESFRRHSSSGPLGAGKAKRALWKTMRRFSAAGSMSEHGVLYRLWPGSH